MSRRLVFPIAFRSVWLVNRKNREMRMMIISVIAYSDLYYFSQLSVRNGEAGKLASLYKLVAGLLDQPYRTATGCKTSGLETTTVLPWIRADAQTNFLLLPAMAKPFNSLSLAIKFRP